MIVSLRHFLGWLVSAFRSREDLVLENLALRRQLLALHAQQPRRRLTALHKLFWVALRTFWSGWTKPLILVTPRTVVNWHRAGFRLYWTWVSRVSQVGGRKRVSKEVRTLIFRMVAENPTWGAPRIHGELLKLGFEVSERTVSRVQLLQICEGLARQQELLELLQRRMKYDRLGVNDAPMQFETDLNKGVFPEPQRAS
jgi:putative transposase